MAEKSPVERALETLIDLSAMSRKANEAVLDRLTAAVEALTLNVSQLATQQKQTANNLDKVGDRIDRLTAAIERQNAAIDGHLAVAQSQAANIAELTKLVTLLISQRTV